MVKIRRVAITMFCLLILTGCSNKEIVFTEDKKYNNMSDYTYKFVGESKHFYFQTGKVYYSNTNKILLISNFKTKKNISSSAVYSINLYFNNKLLYGDISNNKLTKTDVEKIVIAENGVNLEKDKNGNIIGETDAFLETEKDNFKDSIKLIANYCINNHCEEEYFNIKYVK